MPVPRDFHTLVVGEDRKSGFSGLHKGVLWLAKL